MGLIHCEFCNELFITKMPLDCDSYMCNECAQPFVKLVKFLNSSTGKKRFREIYRRINVRRIKDKS